MFLLDVIVEPQIPQQSDSFFGTLSGVELVGAGIAIAIAVILILLDMLNPIIILAPAAVIAGIIIFGVIAIIVAIIKKIFR